VKGRSPEYIYGELKRGIVPDMFMGSFRGAEPLSPNHLPLSFEGEGDKAGSLKNQGFFRVLKGGEDG